MMTEKKRGPGRPKGSKTKSDQMPTVKAEPVQCPACKSTRYRHCYYLQEAVKTGKTPGGKPADYLVRAVKQCHKCGEAFKLSTYTYEGNIGEGAGDVGNLKPQIVKSLARPKPPAKPKQKIKPRKVIQIDQRLKPPAKPAD